MPDYHLKTWYIGAASQVAEQLKAWEPRKLRKIREVSKLHKMIA